MASWTLFRWLNHAYTFPHQPIPKLAVPSRLNRLEFLIEIWPAYHYVHNIFVQPSVIIEPSDNWCKLPSYFFKIILWICSDEMCVTKCKVWKVRYDTQRVLLFRDYLVHATVTIRIVKCKWDRILESSYRCLLVLPFPVWPKRTTRYKLRNITIVWIVSYILEILLE